MTKAEIINIIEETQKNCSTWISIALCGDTIYVTGNYSARKEHENHDRVFVKSEIKRIKKELGDILMSKYTDRKFLHAKIDKCNFWFDGHWNLGHFPKSGIVCGIRIKLTDEEKRNLLLGREIFSK